MDWLKGIIDYILDGGKRLSYKLAIIITILALVILLDNIFGFSFHYNNDRKIDEIEHLNAIIEDASVDSVTKAYCIQMRKDIIQQKSVITQLLLSLRNNNPTSSKSAQNSNTTKISPTTDSAIKNNFLYTISASGFYFLSAVLIVPLLLFLDKGKLPFIQRLALGILTALSISIMGTFVYWIDTHIPQISKSTWTWNYIVNAIIQIVIITFFVTFTIKANKKQKKPLSS
jgi:hypothetical protein